MISSRPSIPAERYRERMAAAQALANEAGLAALLVGVGADMRYLAGYAAIPLERLTMLVIPAAGTPHARCAKARGDSGPCLPSGCGR